MANIRSVSLYSYQEEFFFGRLTLEGMIAEAAKTGARGIEFLAEQYAPDEYADPSDLFINEWNEWMDKYGVTPSCLDIFGDFKMFYNRDLTKKEQLDFFESNFRFAKKLGFPAVRAMIGTPVRYMPEIQALTEKYGVKFGIEMHAPYNFSTPYFQKYLEYVEKSGRKMLGIVPDMSIFTIHVPRVQMSKMLRSGAQPAVVDEICRCYEEGLSIDQADVRIQAMSANQWDNAALKAAYASCNEDPQKLVQNIDKIIHIHGKVYEMTEDCREPSMAYDQVLPMLLEHGYSNFISSEYEGQRNYHDEGSDEAPYNEVEAVRRHQVMMKRLLGE